MTSSILRFLLTHQPDQAELVLAGIQKGEIDPASALAADPGLLFDAVKATSTQQNSTTFSTKRAQLELIQLLDTLGGDLWKTDTYGKDAFHFARIGNSPDLVRWLAQHPQAPADLVARNNKESGLLHNANAKMAQALIDIGVDPRGVDSFGDTLLHKARDEELVKVLLDAGVDPTIKNKKGLDTQKAWDASNMLLEKRQKMEALLARAVPVDPNQVVREFGRQMSEVGVSRSRARLIEAKVDPATAEYAGFSLSELVIAQALKQGISIGGRRQGDPRDQQKWRKLILAAMKMDPSIDPNANTPKMQQVRQCVSLFHRIAGQTLQKTSYAASTASSGMKKKKPKPVDTSWIDILKMVGRLGSDDRRENVVHYTDLIQRMHDAKLVHNASPLSIWLLKDEIKGVSNAQWVQRDADGQSLFVRLGRMATRSQWDTSWNQPLPFADTTAPSALNGLHISREITSVVCQEPGGLGALMLISNVYSLDDTSTVVQACLNSGNHPLLTADDPWLVQGIKRLEGGGTAGHQAIAAMAKSSLDAQALQGATPSVSSKPKTRRF